MLTICFFVLSFKMHALVHDLASSLAQNESSILRSNNHQVFKTARHLSVVDSNSFFQALPKFPNEIERVRTLVFVTSLEEPSCRTDFEKCLSGFKHLRSLELMDVCEFLPDR
jgi:hypothetical protein